MRRGRADQENVKFYIEAPRARQAGWQKNEELFSGENKCMRGSDQMKEGMKKTTDPLLFRC